MNNETINETQNNVENLDITPPLVPNQNIEVYKPEPKKKKSVFGIIFSILGILLITGALGICFYYLFIFNKNGEEVYKSVISKGYNYLDIIYNKANNYLDFKIDKPISFIGNMNLNHNNTDYLYNFECDLDYENEKMAYAQTIYKNNMINLCLKRRNDEEVANEIERSKRIIISTNEEINPENLKLYKKYKTHM